MTNWIITNNLEKLTNSHALSRSKFKQENAE